MEKGIKTGEAFLLFFFFSCLPTNFHSPNPSGNVRRLERARSFVEDRPKNLHAPVTRLELGPRSMRGRDGTTWATALPMRGLSTRFSSVPLINTFLPDVASSASPSPQFTITPALSLTSLRPSITVPRLSPDFPFRLFVTFIFTSSLSSFSIFT